MGFVTERDWSELGNLVTDPSINVILVNIHGPSDKLRIQFYVT